MSEKVVTLDQRLREKATKELEQELNRLFQPILSDAYYYGLEEKSELFFPRGDGTYRMVTVRQVLYKAKQKMLEAMRESRGQTAVEQFLIDFEGFREQVDDLQRSQGGY